VIRPPVEFWSIRTGAEAGGSHQILPDGCFDLVLRCRVEGDDLTDPLLMLSGTADQPVSVPALPNQWFFGLRFRPGWGAAALSLPPDMLGPQPLPAGEGGIWLRDLAGRLQQERWNSAQLHRLFHDLALRTRVQAHDFLSAYPARRRAAWALERLAASGGRLAPAALAREIGISPRSLRRDIAQLTGLSPQSLAGIFRARHALALLQNTALPLVDVAMVAGYADQAHLTRELRRFTGDTPALWRHSGRILQDRSHPLPQDAFLSFLD